MKWLLALVSTCALAQAPEYAQVCPTPDCVARDEWQVRTETTGIAHETAAAAYIRGVRFGSNAVALFGLATQEVAGTAWGMNTLMQDAYSRAVHAETGRQLIGYEADFNVMGPSRVVGVSIGGNSLAQPASALGFVANKLGGPAKWSVAFASMDNVAQDGIWLGGRDPWWSQAIVMWSYTNGLFPAGLVLNASAGDQLWISSTRGPATLHVGRIEADNLTAIEQRLQAVESQLRPR